MKTFSPRTARPAGFSLVELLAGVAIIAVLALLLFPLTQMMRKKANDTACVSNLHSLYLSMNSYKNDGGYWPSVNLNSEINAAATSSQTWYVSLQRLGYIEAQKLRDNNVDVLKGKTVVCPSNDSDPGEAYKYTSSPFPWRPNYAMNYFWGEGSAQGVWYPRVSALGVTNSSAILLIDSTSKTGSIYPNSMAEWSKPKCAIARTHNGGAHALLANGAVITVSPDTHPDIQDPKYWDPRY